MVPIESRYERASLVLEQERVFDIMLMRYVIRYNERLIIRMRFSTSAFELS